MLLDGVGCDKDEVRGTNLTLSAMKRCAKDFSQDDINYVMNYCYKRTQNGSGLEFKIIKAILDDDENALSKAVERVKMLEATSDVLFHASVLFYMAKYNKKHKGED